ncbi:MAG: DUF2177 family protein [Pseudomonadota bacterium]
MDIVTLYVATVAIFLVLDIIALNTVVAPTFRRVLGDMMLDTPRLWAAAVFYLFLVFGLLVLVTLPAYRDGDTFRALWQSALVGAIAYGSYEATNYSTLRAWSLRLVVLDWGWGTVLTAISGWGGVMVTRAIFG